MLECIILIAHLVDVTEIWVLICLHDSALHAIATLAFQENISKLISTAMPAVPLFLQWEPL